MERITPLLWLLFSAGGTVAALLLPVHLFLTGLAFPLGLFDPPSYESLRGLLAQPLTQLGLLPFGLRSTLLRLAHLCFG